MALELVDVLLAAVDVPEVLLVVLEELLVPVALDEAAPCEDEDAADVAALLEGLCDEPPPPYVMFEPALSLLELELVATALIDDPVTASVTLGASPGSAAHATSPWRTGTSQSIRRKTKEPMESNPTTASCIFHAYAAPSRGEG